MRTLLVLLVLVVGCDKASSAGGSTGSAAPIAAAADSVLPGSAGGTTVKVGAPPVAMGTPATTQEWKVGDKIQGKWSDGRWYDGKISAVNDDHTWNIKYHDRDVSNHFKADRIRAPKTSSNTGGGGGHSAPAGNAPCPGPGLTRRCGGVCVNIQEDNNNCGSCGNRCSGGKRCDGHMFCRDVAGNL